MLSCRKGPLYVGWSLRDLYTGLGGVVVCGLAMPGRNWLVAGRGAGVFGWAGDEEE
jgi:hypothetical protein